MERLIKLSLIPIYAFLLFPGYTNADVYLRDNVGFPFTIPMISMCMFLMIAVPYFFKKCFTRRLDEVVEPFLNLGWIIMPFLLLILIRILYIIPTEFLWVEGGARLYSIFYYFLFLLVAIMIAVTPTMQKYNRDIFLIILIGSVLSTWVDTIIPGFFSESKARAAGFALNANGSAVSTLFIGIASVNWKDHTIKNLIVLLITGLGVFLTLSVGGMLFFVITIALYVVFVLRQNVSIPKVIGSTLVAVFVVFGFMSIKDAFMENSTALSSVTSQDRMEEMFKLGSGDTTFIEQHERFDLLKDYFFLISQNPIIGYGPKFSGTMRNSPHNLYLYFWVEYGIFGFLALLFAILSSFFYFYKLGDLRGMVFIIIFACTSFYDHSLLNVERVYILLGFLGALAYLDNRSQRKVAY
jgi:O-antigen ligase